MVNHPYPRDPANLRWDEHYIMADQVYAAYTCGGPPPRFGRAQPDPLPEAEKAAKRVHRKTGLGGKRIA